MVVIVEVKFDYPSIVLKTNVWSWTKTYSQTPIIVEGLNLRIVMRDLALGIIKGYTK